MFQHKQIRAMPLRIEQNTPFVARWNNSNLSLNPDTGDCLDKALRKLKNFFFYIPNTIIAACVNSRSATLYAPSAPLTGNSVRFTKEIITPDQVHLTAHVYVTAAATLNTPTVILFNPLGTNDGVHGHLKACLIERRCNVVTFDYRGFGSTWRADDFVLDGDSVFQYVTQELGTQIHKVHFFGVSLGGAIAVQVKGRHFESKGKYAGDRPFKSVFKLITEFCCIEKLGPVIKKITSFVAAISLAYPVYLLGWEWDSSVFLPQLKGDKRILYHPNDFLVSYEASQASICPPEQVISLDRNVKGFSTHFDPIEKHNTDDGKLAVEVIADFLVDPNW